MAITRDPPSPKPTQIVKIIHHRSSRHTDCNEGYVFCSVFALEIAACERNKCCYGLVAVAAFIDRTDAVPHENAF
jgi:hypothetical protein